MQLEAVGATQPLKHGAVSDPADREFEDARNQAQRAGPWKRIHTCATVQTGYPRMRERYYLLAPTCSSAGSSPEVLVQGSSPPVRRGFFARRGGEAAKVGKKLRELADQAAGLKE